MFADQDNSFSPVPSDRSDDFTELFSSRVWEDEDKDQKVECYMYTKSTRDPKGSLAGIIASDKAECIDRKEKHKRDSSAAASRESTIHSSGYDLDNPEGRHRLPA